jgi:hypothetical protein
MKRETLKKTALALFSLCLAFIFGCSENSTLNQPDNKSSSTVFKNDLSTLDDSTQTWTPIVLPAENQLGKKDKKGKGSTGFTVTGLIEAAKKSKLQIKDKYSGGPHGEVSVEIKVEFAANTVAEDTYITMTFDPSTGVTTFLPHMIFEKRAKVSVMYKGADLSDIEDEESINFMFLDDNGEYKAIDKKKYKIKIKKKEGKVEVKDVEDLGFSRYMFTR